MLRKTGSGGGGSLQSPVLRPLATVRYVRGHQISVAQAMPGAHRQAAQLGCAMQGMGQARFDDSGDISLAVDSALPQAVRFAVGEWRFDTTAQELRRVDERVALEPRQTAVLAALCRNAGSVLSADALLDECWPGQASGDNPVHKAIANLRRLLQDSATAPRYIETIRKQGYRLIARTRVIAGDGERSHRGSWRGSSPFRGLEAFGAAHASVFFGRDAEVALLRERLGEQWRRGEGLVLLLGPSGSGKTSLVQAGLLPAMALDAGTIVPSEAGAPSTCAAAVIGLDTPDGEGAWTALAGGLLDWEVAGVPLLSGHSIDGLAADLRDAPERVVEALRVGLQAHGPRAASAPPLLVIDRLEALFQSPLAEAAGLVVQRLETLVDSGLLMVLGICRNDFYAGLAAHRLFMRGKPLGSHVDLEPPGADSISQIIRLPARAAGLSYASDPSGLHRLDDRLCADAVRARDALPLLQYTLHSLYLARAPGEVLTWESYAALGGLEGAVGQRAEGVLAGLPPRQQEAFERLLPRLIGSMAEDGACTGRWMRESELVEPDEAGVARALVEARLLVADRVGGAAGVRIAHEALLRRWPRVTNWIARHRAALAVRDELQAWVQRWRESAHAPSLLLPSGLALWRAVAALAQAPQVFSDEEQGYVARSQARLQRQALLRWAGAAGVAVLALVAGFAAVRNAQLARLASERELQSQRLASFMLGDLADRLRPIGKLDLLGSIGEQGVTLFGQRGEGGETPADAFRRAKALVVIGEVDGSRGSGRTAVAIAALREARTLLEALRPGGGVPLADYYKTLGASAFWLGQIALDAADFDEAALQMAHYRDASDQWRHAAPEDTQARAELGFAFGGLGSVALRRGAWADAAHWFESSLDLKLAALAARPDDAEAVEAVANARTSLGELAYIQGDPRRALTLYDSAWAMEEAQRVRHPDQAVRLLVASIGQVRRAEALQALGRHGEAVAEMQQVSSALRQLVAADPRNRRWAGELLHVDSGLALAKLDAGRPVDDDLRTLQDRLGQADAALRDGYLWHAASVRAAAATATLASAHGDVARAQAAITLAGRALDDLLAKRPHDWQGEELRARLALLELAPLPRREPAALDAGRCERLVASLQPAVDSGQGGVVLEGWLLARQCAGTPAADGPWIARLTAGGYQPIALQVPSTHPW